MTRLEWFIQQALKPMRNVHPIGLEEGNGLLLGFALTEHCSMGRWKDCMRAQDRRMVPIITDWPRSGAPDCSGTLQPGISSVDEWIDID